MFQSFLVFSQRTGQKLGVSVPCRIYVLTKRSAVMLSVIIPIGWIISCNIRGIERVEDVELRTSPILRMLAHLSLPCLLSYGRMMATHPQSERIKKNDRIVPHVLIDVKPAPIRNRIFAEPPADAGVIPTVQIRLKSGDTNRLRMDGKDGYFSRLP